MKQKIKDFIFGERKTYRIQTDLTVLDVSGRRFSMNKKGFLVVRDCFFKVGTFLNVRHIVEI